MSLELNIIVFSKDRAAQTSACVRSLYKHFKESNDEQVVKTTVLYKSSSDILDRGYEKAKKTLAFVNLSWVREQDFRKQIIDLLETDSKKVMFLVDDIIFVRPWSLTDQQIQLVEHHMMLATSLRLHPGINFCYATDKPSSVPKFVKQYIWTWQTGEGDWGYPMSVDGNVYRTEMIKRLISNLNFTNPNSFEAALDSAKVGPLMPSHMACYLDGPKLVNIPANRVQHQYKNRFADGYSAEELNTFYLAGKEIDIEAYDGIKPSTCHVPVELILKETQ